MAVAAAAQAPPAPDEPLERRVERLEREIERQLGMADGEPLAATPAPIAAQNVFNPSLTVVGNGLYRWDDRNVLTEEGDRIDRRFWLREVELDMRAAVDPFADGVAIVAVEAEAPGVYEAIVEEGYVVVKSLPVAFLERPPLGLKLRVGRFFTETGRVNRLHTHDLPWPLRPLAVEEFLGEEGSAGDGASAQLFLPFPFDDESAVELTAQLVTGGALRVSEEGTNAPGVVSNLRWFRTFARAHHVDVAGIVHWGRGAADEAVWLASGDALYKWKPLRGGEFRSFVLGGQVFWARPAPQRPRPWGFFAWTQVQPWRSVYLGIRYDDTESVLDPENRRRAASGFLSWYPSEFLRLRAGYERRWSDQPEEDGRDSVLVDVNFVFGAHPTEPFWVNR
jgi:hypothetical protein